MTYASLEPDGVTPTFGGYSRDIVVDEHFVLSIPDGLDPGRRRAAAVRGDHHLLAAARGGTDEGLRVAVMGLGGLGHMGVKLAASFGAEVTVLSRSPEKEADAKTAGRARLRPHEHARRARRAGRPLRCHPRHDFSQARSDAGAECPEAARHPDPGRRVAGGRGVQPVPAAVRRPQDRRLPGRRHSGNAGDARPLRQARHRQRYRDDHPDQINVAFDRTNRGDVKYRFVIDCTKF